MNYLALFRSQILRISRRPQLASRFSHNRSMAAISQTPYTSKILLNLVQLPSLGVWSVHTAHTSLIRNEHFFTGLLSGNLATYSTQRILPDLAPWTILHSSKRRKG